MSASLRTLSLEEFLVWERSQPLRYEFDGVQPIPMGMTGGSIDHERLIARAIIAVGGRLRDPCEVFASGLKVITDGRVRYPDLSVACGAADGTDDVVRPKIVFEVLSPSSTLTDRRVKAAEYRQVPSILAYVILSQDKPEVTVMRRAEDWREVHVVGREARLSLPDIDAEIPLSELYR